MKRPLRSWIVSLAAAIVLFGAFQYTRAQSPPPNATVRPPSAAPMKDPPKGALVLLETYMTQGFPEVYFPYDTYDTVDGVTNFYCAWPGCTLEFQQVANVYGFDYEDDYSWYLGAYVDGNYYWSGPMGTLYYDYLTATFDWSITLGPGKHTVQSVLYTYDDLYVESYHMNYRVYVNAN